MVCVMWVGVNGEESGGEVLLKMNIAVLMGGMGGCRCITQQQQPLHVSDIHTHHNRHTTTQQNSQYTLRRNRVNTGRREVSRGRESERDIDERREGDRGETREILCVKSKENSRELWKKPN